MVSKETTLVLVTSNAKQFGKEVKIFLFFTIQLMLSRLNFILQLRGSVER